MATEGSFGCFSFFKFFYYHVARNILLSALPPFLSIVIVCELKFLMKIVTLRSKKATQIAAATDRWVATLPGVPSATVPRALLKSALEIVLNCSVLSNYQQGLSFS